MNKKTLEKATAGFFYLFAFVMLGIAVWLCWNESIWSDEAFSLQIIKHSYTDVIKITAGDVHPPLYYFILKFIVDMIHFLFPKGSTVIIGKCVSVLPVLILIMVSWFIVRTEWGLLTAAVFAMSVIGMPHLMYYAIEIRMYSWGMLFVTLAFLEAYRVTKYRKTIDWVWFTVFGLCAAYTQYFALIEVAFAYLYLLVFFLISDKKRIKEWLIVAAVTSVCYLPWLGCVISQVAKVNQEYWIEASGFSKMKDYIIYIACPEIVHSAARLSVKILLLLFAFLMLVKVYNALRYDKYGGGVLFEAFAAICLPATMFLGIVISIIMRPIFVDRYLIPAAGALWLALAILVNYKYFTRKRLGQLCSIAVCILLVASCMINTSERVKRESSIKRNYDKLENMFEEYRQGTVVITNDAHLVRTLNTITKVECYLFSDEAVVFMTEFYDNVGSIKTPEEVQEIISEHEDIYIVLNKETGFPTLQDILIEEENGVMDCGDYCLERYSLKIYKVKK